MVDLYSAIECCEFRGLDGVIHARVERWVDGKRWIWESMIEGHGILMN